MGVYIPSSQIPIVPPPLRTTKKALSSVRNTKEDELPLFLQLDKTTFPGLQNVMLANKRTFAAPVTSYMVDGILYIQSTEFVEGIPLFLVKIHDDLKFDTYHCGIKCYVSTLSKNEVNTVRFWSVLEEMICFLSSEEKSNKK